MGDSRADAGRGELAHELPYTKSHAVMQRPPRQVNASFPCDMIAAVTESTSTGGGPDRGLLDDGLSVKVRLAGLWTALMLLYVYADILSFYRPGQIAEIESGKLGPFDVSQTSLVLASLIVIVPALMIALSLTLRASLNRPANLALGLLYTLVNVGNLLESWVYYVVFGLLEIALTLTIVATAWKWPRRDASAAATTGPTEG